MTAEGDLVAAARALVDRPDVATRGLWARASAVLIRQALEGGVARLWARKAPGLQAAPFAAQLLVLAETLDDRALVAEVAWTWVAVSQATHHQGYPLPPVRADLVAWADTVDRFLARVA